MRGLTHYGPLGELFAVHDTVAAFLALSSDLLRRAVRSIVNSEIKIDNDPNYT